MCSYKIQELDYWFLAIHRLGEWPPTNLMVLLSCKNDDITIGFPGPLEKEIGKEMIFMLYEYQSLSASILIMIKLYEWNTGKWADYQCPSKSQGLKNVYWCVSLWQRDECCPLLMPTMAHSSYSTLPNTFPTILYTSPWPGMTGWLNALLTFVVLWPFLMWLGWGSFWKMLLCM